MKEDKKKGIGLSYAINGMVQVIKQERNMRIHCMFALCAILLGFVLGLSTIEWLILIITITIVFVLEIINSVCERMVDYIKPDITEEAKLMKDMAAGAVLLAAISSIIIGCLLFIPKILKVFGV